MDGTGGLMALPFGMPPQRMMRPQLYARPNARNFQPRPGSELAKQLEANPDSTIVGQNALFDGKRMRKAMHRKTVDYNSAVIQYLENRVWQRDARDARAIQPDSLYQLEIPPPCCMMENPMNCVTTKFIRTSTNKFRCPIFCVAWTPEGRRLITGASSGEFTLWNGLTFNFETILQAHDTSVRAMVWSHNDAWMVTADHSGFIKYWQSNMNNVKMYQGHKDPVRGIRYYPCNFTLVASPLFRGLNPSLLFECVFKGNIHHRVFTDILQFLRNTVMVVAFFCSNLLLDAVHDGTEIFKILLSDWFI